METGRSSSAASVSGVADGIRERTPARATRRVSSRHSLSAFSHSRPSTGRLQAFHASAAFADDGMRRNRHPAQPGDVLDDVARFTAEGIRRGPHTPSTTTCPSKVVTSTASMQSTPPRYDGGSGSRVAVAVIREDDELQAGTRGGCRNLIGGAGAVRLPAVHVHDALHRVAFVRRRERDGARRQGRSRSRRPHGGDQGDEPPVQSGSHDRHRCWLRLADDSGRRPPACAVPARACRSASSTGPRGRASSEWRADRRRAPAGAWRRSAAGRAD